LLVIVVVVGLISVAIRQFDSWGKRGGSVGDAVRSGVHDLTGKTAADLGRQTMSYASRARISRAVREYVAERGDVPGDLDALVERGLIHRDTAVDEWGRALGLESSEDGVLIRSAGPDGRFHTGDDWTVDL
jgi:hypothetical protein